MSSIPAPRHRSGPVVGYDPVDLGKSIRRYTQIAERNLGDLEKLGERVKEAMEALCSAPAGAALDDAESVSIIYDRLVKAGLNLVKATDELARLHSFLSGGPDSRPDLSSLSEIELRGVVLAAIKALGINDLSELTSASPA